MDSSTTTNGEAVRRLPGVRGHQDADGLNVERLQALAGAIEGLPASDWHEGDGLGPVGQMGYVRQAEPPTHFTLRAGGQGLGVLRFARAGDGEVAARAVTGYGLACWAWGKYAGLAAVASNGRVRDVEQVLNAAPVIDGKCGPRLRIEPHHVAEAVRAYLRCLDPVAAWAEVVGAHAQERPAAPEPEPAPEPKPPAPAEQPPDARWRVLLSQERWAEAAALAEEQVAALRVWERRLRVARAGLED